MCFGMLHGTCRGSSRQPKQRSQAPDDAPRSTKHEATKHGSLKPVPIRAVGASFQPESLHKDPSCGSSIGARPCRRGHGSAAAQIDTNRPQSRPKAAMRVASLQPRRSTHAHSVYTVDLKVTALDARGRWSRGPESSSRRLAVSARWWGHPVSPPQRSARGPSPPRLEAADPRASVRAE